MFIQLECTFDMYKQIRTFNEIIVFFFFEREWGRLTNTWTLNRTNTSHEEKVNKSLNNDLRIFYEKI